MKICKTKIKDLIYIEPNIFSDDRGEFFRVFCMKEMEKITKTKFVQFNHSINKLKGTFRGMHYQSSPFQESKLVKCIKGSVIDVVIDLRESSDTYLQHELIELSEKNKRAIYIPKCFAHGFITLQDDTHLMYFHDEFFSGEHGQTLNIKDPKLKIDLKNEIKVISEKDLNSKYIETKILL